MSNTFELAPRQTAISFFFLNKKKTFSFFFHHPFFYKNTPAQANHLLTTHIADYFFSPNKQSFSIEFVQIFLRSEGN